MIGCIGPLFLWVHLLLCWQSAGYSSLGVLASTGDGNPFWFSQESRPVSSEHRHSSTATSSHNEQQTTTLWLWMNSLLEVIPLQTKTTVQFSRFLKQIRSSTKIRGVSFSVTRWAFSRRCRSQLHLRSSAECSDEFGRSPSGRLLLQGQHVLTVPLSTLRFQPP